MTATDALPPDPEFAALLDSEAAAAVAEGDYEMADYLFAVADQFAEPDEGTRTARIMLLSAAIAGEAARGRTR